jgi:hypothetical protein
MTQTRGRWAGVACAGVLAAGAATAQGALLVGGSRANFGVQRLAPGFVPDPRRVAVVSGGALNARAMGLGPGCVGWVTAQPDLIVRLTGRSANLRFYAVAADGTDITLLVNANRTVWRCNDDSFGGTNPLGGPRQRRGGPVRRLGGELSAGDHRAGHAAHHRARRESPLRGGAAAARDDPSHGVDLRAPELSRGEERGDVEPPRGGGLHQRADLSRDGDARGEGPRDDRAEAGPEQGAGREKAAPAAGDVRGDEREPHEAAEEGAPREAREHRGALRRRS